MKSTESHHQDTTDVRTGAESNTKSTKTTKCEDRAEPNTKSTKTTKCVDRAESNTKSTKTTKREDGADSAGEERRSFLPVPKETERVAKEVVDAVVQVHRILGPGLLESVYETCLCHELRKRGLRVEQQTAVPIVYDGVKLESGFRLDLLVDKKVIIEVKAVEKMAPIFQAQLLTYVRLTDVRLGLLVNFNVRLVKDGIERIVV